MVKMTVDAMGWSTVPIPVVKTKKSAWKITGSRTDRSACR